ncbi:helveticin J family class III bacteriocin [Levilactobacillus cerevisiae]|uniref:helveticin J family class III bacteriocin n=1 Tax=Levilactobacillus cerevisiae TaxID=1704076 RepID=UPI000F76AFA2|nr:helveticin J family class III bacteriocin [Levilactobacillus cerevisiae]
MATPKLLYRLKGLRGVAVQKTYIGAKYIYVQQLVDQQQNMIISRALKPGSGVSEVNFKGAEVTRFNNFGHCQTLDFFEGKNKEPYWLVTTRSAKATTSWSNQVARITFDKKVHEGNTSVTRLSNISSAYPTSFKMKRLEAAVSTDKKKILIASIDTNDTMHPVLYDVAQINAVLDRVESTHGQKSLSEVKGGLFGKVIPSFAKAANSYGSIQGLELSDGKAIYVSGGGVDAKAPVISKFYWNSTTRSSLISLSHSDWNGFFPEPEGLQLGSTLSITVANHQIGQGNPTVANNVYEVDKHLLG